jgi:uncharacterized protein
MSSFCPDINVWIALAYRGHQHHTSANSWFATLDDETAYFCRLTQLGFLRLLTLSQVMHEDIQSQKQAWLTYDKLMESDNVAFLTEPDNAQLEFRLRQLSSNTLTSAKQWPDAYIAAFAKTSGLTLVTFDRALSQNAPGTVLLLS